MRRMTNRPEPPLRATLPCLPWRTLLSTLGLLLCAATLRASDPPPTTQPAPQAEAAEKTGQPERKRSAKERPRANPPTTQPAQQGDVGRQPAQANKRKDNRGWRRPQTQRRDARDDASALKEPAPQRPARTAPEAPQTSTTQPTQGEGAPVFACDVETVAAEPVWSGESISCTFTVRNPGTADLTFKTRCG
ncbi:MAG TPA: hypothetical protein VM243_00685 [Phycisphaerae bacterium]|nr:hypothetical protein [Phycisphaerae bacterium]